MGAAYGKLNPLRLILLIRVVQDTLTLDDVSHTSYTWTAAISTRVQLERNAPIIINEVLLLLYAITARDSVTVAIS